MEQLTHTLRSGDIRVCEVPAPACDPDTVLVQNHYSLISPGTEGSTVKAARSNLLEKARARPQQVKKLFQVLETQGPVQAYRAVMKKLDVLSPLGYSCAGRVVAVGDGVETLSVGDLAACGGLTACHAEFVRVPANLCVKLAPDADLQQAAYNTLGAIALQGIRQADLNLGETCAVIGLGLIGQLTCLLLRAAGVRTAGIDIDAHAVDLAERYCADLAFLRSDASLESRVRTLSGGIGCAAVIITAAAATPDPINLAGALCRKKGTVVVVGDVPTGFQREPHYYRKELQVKMSCSYGPGRYDAEYEEKGRDYPVAYVRWTENRNMQAFQNLIQSGRIDLSYLTTHVFSLAEAPAAYDLILRKSEPHLGMLIRYEDRGPAASVSTETQVRSPRRIPGSTPVGLGFIGAGSYAQSHLLPNVTQRKDVMLKTVMTSTPASSRSAAERFGFESATLHANDILTNPEIDAVFIATRHDSHAGYVVRALEQGKHVFVEKPLCLTLDELEGVHAAYAPHYRSRETPLVLMVGYNRRFSPLTGVLKKHLRSGPISTVYRINAGAIPPDSWIQDRETGGGRIIGEVCHFIDLITFLTGSFPVSVSAAVLVEPHNLKDTLSVLLRYENGSIGSIHYFSNGDTSLPKERLEVYGHGCAYVLDDFRILTLHQRGRVNKQRLLSQDKGQKTEVNEFLKAVREGLPSPIPFADLLSASYVTFRILDSLKGNQTVECSLPADPGTA